MVDWPVDRPLPWRRSPRSIQWRRFVAHWRCKASPRETFALTDPGGGPKLIGFSRPRPPAIGRDREWVRFVRLFCSRLESFLFLGL